MTAKFTIPSVFTAVDRFSGPMKSMGAATSAFASRAEVSMARAERGFRGLMAPLAGLRNMLNNVGYYVGIYTFIRAMRGAFDIVADFEQAQVDIAAVTGRSINQNKAMADQARVLSLRYGEAAKSVLALDLNLIKLGYAQSDVMKMSESVMTASIALKGIPDEVGKKMGAILQAFKIPTSSTQDVADLLAKAADLSALDWSDLSTMLPTAMQSAALAWNDVAPLEQFKRLLALFATVRNAQVHVASGATGIKNMLVDAGIRGKSYQELIDKIIQSPNELKKAYKLFGRRTLVSALPIAEAQKMGSIEDFIQKLTTQAPGYAMQVAEKRLNSMRGSLKLLGTAYDEFILSFESGEGKLSRTISGFLQITRTMFLLAAGTDEARVQIAKMPQTIVDTANQWMGWLSVIWGVIKTLIFVKAVLMAMRFVLLVTNAAQWLWNAALMVTGLLHRKNLISLLTSARALMVYNVATRTVAIGQTLMNIAMFASPLILFAIGIIAIVGGMKLLSSWMNSAVMGINAYSDAMGGAMDQYEKFNMQQQSQFADPNSAFRVVDPNKAYQYDMSQKQAAYEQMMKENKPLNSDFKTDVKERVNNRVVEKEQGFRQSQMDGTIKLIVDDKGNIVKDVESDNLNLNIMPKTTGTQADWLRNIQNGR